MKDSALKLQDKTVLLLGPFNGVTQALMRTMTELGADVAFVNDQAPLATKYADAVNEAREIHQDYGRAAHFGLPLKTVEHVREALGRVAETLGRMDVLVDASPIGWNDKTDVTEALKFTDMLSEQLMPFFQVKKRGRIVYIFEDPKLSALGINTIVSNYQEQLTEHIRKTAATAREKQITINGLALGITEDFVLRHYPKSGSIRKTLTEIQGTHPAARLVENVDINLCLAYLASQQGASLTGQVLFLNHGFGL